MTGKENKFFDKFIENLSRLDESNVKRYLASVEKERRTFKATLDLLDDGILVIQSDSVIFMNRSAKKLLMAPVTLPTPIGFAEMKKQVVNMKLLDFIAASLHDQDYETEISEKARDMRYYRIQKISTEGDFRIVKIKDVTLDRTLDLHLKNAESIGALNTLAAGVAHEIKNPLTAIDLHTQIIRRGIDKNIVDVPAEVREYIRIVDEEQKRLSQIVNDFLMAARKRELVLTYQDVPAFLRDILALMDPEFRAAGIDLSTDFQDTPGIFMDRDYLRQAFLNLFKNAIEAVRQAAAADPSRLRVVKVRSFYEPSRDAVGISISDTGGGLGDDMLQKIFEPYFTTKEYGTGLGLTIVYKIVREHGGEILVESRKGEGSDFTVYLPLVRGPKMIRQSGDPTPGRAPRSKAG